jgi:enoyl-CoA hydratase/carnithine racemase
MSARDFQQLTDLFPDEVVTHSHVQDVALPGVDGAPGAGTFALITLDNGLDHRRPSTLGPNTLVELGTVLQAQRERAARGEIAGVGVTGKPFFLAAGADLSAVKELKDKEAGRAMARLGHDVYSTLNDLGVPSFVFINGMALGGGLEIALNANYRTVSTGAGALALPEAFLGLVPGWGGVYLLPRLIGPANAVKVMLENALSNNRTLSGPEAFKLGMADALFEPADFVEQSLNWAARVLAGAESVSRPNAVDEPLSGENSAAWDAAVDHAKAFVEAKTSNAAPAPAKVIDLLEKGRNFSKAESFEAEEDALAELMMTPQFRDTVYAFLDLVQKRGKRPAGAPDATLARPVTKVGVVGAGLMAGQFALLFARQLKVPVVLTDIDAARVDKGVGYVHGEVDKLLAKGRISPDAANRTKSLVTGSVTKDAFADADFVIEAVFLVMGVN